MLICPKSGGLLGSRIASSMETYCSGLFLSARWMVVSNVGFKGLNLIVLPDAEAAEYCASDLYDLTEGD